MLLTLKVTVLVAEPLRLMKVCGLRCHLSAPRVGAMNKWKNTSPETPPRRSCLQQPQRWAAAVCHGLTSKQAKTPAGTQSSWASDPRLPLTNNTQVDDHNLPCSAAVYAYLLSNCGVRFLFIRNGNVAVLANVGTVQFCIDSNHQHFANWNTPNICIWNIQIATKIQQNRFWFLLLVLFAIWVTSSTFRCGFFYIFLFFFALVFHWALSGIVN